MEAMKQEILREMRKEINKAKLEIIEGMDLCTDKKIWGGGEMIRFYFIPWPYSFPTIFLFKFRP